MNALERRLFGAATASQIIVVPARLGRAVALPGGLILVDDAMLARVDDPVAFAGSILVAHAARIERDPLAHVLDHIGLPNTLRLFTRGEISEDLLRGYASSVLMAPTQTPEIDLVIATFDAARVPSTPFADHLAAMGTPSPALITRDPWKDTATPAVLSDQDWVALQGICD